MSVLVRSMLWAFALACLVSGSGALAQQAPSEACQQLEDQLRSACCEATTSQYAPEGRLFYSGRSRATFVAVNDCDGGTIAVRCVRRAAIGLGASVAPRSDQRFDTSAADTSLPACRATWLSVHSTPGAENCGLDEIPSCSADVELSSLPVCEDLEALQGEVHCSAWNLSRCLGYRGAVPYSRENERECLRQWTAEAGKKAQQELRPAFTADDAKLSGLTYPKANPVPAGVALPTPSQPDVSSLVASERIIPGFRVEVPGNFWRYNTRVVAAAVIADLGEDLADGGLDVDGVAVAGDCRESDLSCRLNQAHLLNLEKLIAEKRQFVDPSTAGTSDQAQGFVNAKVRKSESGWDVSDIEFNAGPFGINWWGTVKVTSERPMSFKLSGPDTRLKLLPLHDPKDQNPPHRAANLRALDSKARYLDRTWVLWGMPRQACSDLRALTFEDNEFKPGPAESSGLGVGVYRTLLQPYKCDCSAPGGVYGVNYCVVDPYPRPVNTPAFSSGLPEASDFVANIVRINGAGLGRLTEVFCDDDREPVNRNLIRDLGPGPQKYFTSENVGNVFGPGILASDMARLRNDIFEFGCMGRETPRLDAGGERRLNEQQEPRLEGQQVSSGIGFEFETTVDLGRIRTWVSPSPITMEFPNAFKAHKWIKKKIPLLTGFWADIVGWIITFVLAIFSVVLTVVVSLHLLWIGPVITGFGIMAADIDAGVQHVTVQGVISYEKGANERTAYPGYYVSDGQLEVGVRRIVTSTPAADSSTWALEWSAPACNDIIDGEGKEGFEEVLNFLKNTVACPLEAIGNLYNVLTLPVKNLLLWLTNELIFDVQGAAEQAISAAIIDEFSNAQDDANLANLIVSSLQESLDVPYHLITDADVKNDLGNVQPHIDAVCALAGAPVADCAVARLFAYYGEGPTVVRLGAKTHYRSMQDYGVSSVTQILNATPFARVHGEPFYPPARYCYGGDIPAAGLADYSDAGSPGLLRTLTTLDEMHYTAAGAPPTDWRTQCASFADLRVRGNFRLRLPSVGETELVVAPSVRSNFLINEVFFCPDESSCDMGVNVASVIDCAKTDGCDVADAIHVAFETSGLSSVVHPVRVRASRAVCSMMGDIWLQARGPNARFANLLSSDVATARATLAGTVAATCPANGDCADQIAAINMSFASTAQMCRTLLVNYGLFNPDRTLARTDFPPEVLTP